MKYSDVINLMNGGIQAISSRTLGIGDAYIVVKFKSAIKKAFEQYQEEEDALLKEAGITDAKSFFQKHRELVSKRNRDSIDEGVLQQNNEKIERFNSLQAEAQKKEIDLGISDRLTFDAWRSLLEENKDIKTNGNVEILSAFEVDLEGVLWEMKSEEKKQKKA